jgi:hypothetical protein
MTTDSGSPIDLAAIAGLFSFPAAVLPTVATSGAVRIGRRRRRPS